MFSLKTKIILFLISIAYHRFFDSTACFVPYSTLLEKVALLLKYYFGCQSAESVNTAQNPQVRQN
jgi:hypothetical protein